MTSGQVADHMRRVGLNPDECDLLEITGKGEEPETIPTRLAQYIVGVTSIAVRVWSGLLSMPGARIRVFW